MMTIRQLTGAIFLACCPFAPAFGVPIVLVSPHPDDLSSWFRADQGVTVGTGGVSQWQDQSGNGNHATQGDDTKRPSVVSGGLNGHDYLTLSQISDGVQGDHFVMPSQSFPNGGNGMHVFLVSRTFDNENRGTSWLGDSSTLPVFMADSVFTTTGGPNLRFRGGGTSEAQASGSVTVFHISEYRFDGTDTLLALYNSVAGTSATDATAAFTLDNIGAYVASNPEWSGEGDLAEILIYDRQLTADEANRTGTYLSLRYDIPAVNYNFTAFPQVPEPSTFSLCGLGLLASTRYRRRRLARSCHLAYQPSVD